MYAYIESLRARIQKENDRKKTREREREREIKRGCTRARVAESEEERGRGWKRLSERKKTHSENECVRERGRKETGETPHLSDVRHHVSDLQHHVYQICGT